MEETQMSLSLSSITSTIDTETTLTESELEPDTTAIEATGAKQNEATKMSPSAVPAKNRGAPGKNEGGITRRIRRR